MPIVAVYIERKHNADMFANMVTMMSRAFSQRLGYIVAYDDDLSKVKLEDCDGVKFFKCLQDGEKSE